MYSNIKYLKIELPEDILKLKWNGNFEEAIKLIDMRLKKEIPMSLKKRLELEKEIINVMKDDYPYSFEEALKKMQNNIRDFTEEELVTLQEESAADWILVDGKVKFNDSFYGNLLKTRPDIAGRLINNSEAEDKRSNLLDDNIKAMKVNGKASYFIHLKNSIKLKDEYVRLGENIKVHMPLPIDCQFVGQQIKNININETRPKAKFIAPDNYPQRTAYFETTVKDNLEFAIEYMYESHANYIDLDYTLVIDNHPNFEMQELEPHIMFTPYIKELTKEIIGDETNPLIKTRKIYDFITTNVKYSFVRQYSTITNIPEYAALNLKGDCGIQALLFITLCRCAKIPARWQSGLAVTPYHVGCHDWAQFYVEPYGWLFADPSFGGGAYRSGNFEKWNFYFGNIDPFRMPANSEFQREFSPPKKYFRHDPYDNQVGECEYEDRGLLRKEFKVNLDLVEMYEI